MTSLSFSKSADRPYGEKKTWKLLIVDDENEVHIVTKLALQKFTFDNRSLQIFDAYSAKECIDIMKKHPDIAVVLLDVVMETDNAGLEAVKIIRNELQNKNTRIILRTGQPGQAPEKTVILEYDINDYKQKTELTSQKLFTAMVSAIRTYQDIITIEQSRAGLLRVLDSLGDIYSYDSIQTLASAVLLQLVSILNLDSSALYFRRVAYAANDNGHYIILAGTGAYEQEKIKGQDIRDIVPRDVFDNIDNAKKLKGFWYDDGRYIGYFQEGPDVENIIYLESCLDLEEQDLELLKIFGENVAKAYTQLLHTIKSLHKG